MADALQLSCRLPISPKDQSLPIFAQWLGYNVWDQGEKSLIIPQEVVPREVVPREVVLEESI